MLLSMTGHGEAAGQNERMNVTMEVRSVNNRHLKVSVRCPDAYLSLESNIERVVRTVIARGTLTIHLRIQRLTDQHGSGINTSVARHYWSQLQLLAESIGAEPPQDLSALLSLPGIVEENDTKSVTEKDWPLIEEVVQRALRNLQLFREEEGNAMGAELTSLTDSIESNLSHVVNRAPNVVADYRERLKTRVNELLSSSMLHVDDKDLIRELSLFADRCDITEEITRLRSHLLQYRTVLQQGGACGRKLEFLGQEIFREVNTIGSKANDVEIAHLVVDMKAAVEKMREIIQNIE